MTTSGMSSARLQRLRDTMNGFVERDEVPGIVTAISRHGEAHVDAFGSRARPGRDPMRRDTIFRIASLTKPVTGVAAMILVEECKLRLDDPVDALLPELADRRVLTRLDARLDDTVPARRAITVRDVLTSRMGFGSVMASAEMPIRRAVRELGIGGDGPPHPSKAVPPDEWLRRLGTLPLLSQPGEQFHYNVAVDVLGVLIARASGRSFSQFLRERIFEPLGMTDTAFYVPAEKIGRLSGCYFKDARSGRLLAFDEPEQSEWASPPAFESGAGGLVSTVDDYLAFCRMLLDKGRVGRDRILSRSAVELMTMNHLTQQQRDDNQIFFHGHSGWGFCVAVDTVRDNLYTNPGRFGWTGGLGTSGYADPREDMIGVVLTTRMMESPVPPTVFTDFFTSAYQAIGD